MDNLSAFSRGGGGYAFELEVIAAFSVLMLSQSSVPCFDNKERFIQNIKLQGYDEYHTDDMIINCSKGIYGKEEDKILCQVKVNIDITDNESFRKVVKQAWRDFGNKNSFTQGKDSIALITNMLEKKDIIHTRRLLELAKQTNHHDDFFLDINREKKHHQVKVKKYELFRKIINEERRIDENTEDEEIYNFLRSFYLLGMDLDTKNGLAYSLFKTIISLHGSESPPSVWSRILDQCKDKNQHGVTYDINGFHEEIQEIFVKDEIKDDSEDRGIAPLRVTRDLDQSIAQRVTQSQNKSISDEELYVIFNLFGALNENNEYDLLYILNFLEG